MTEKEKTEDGLRKSRLNKTDDPVLEKLREIEEVVRRIEQQPAVRRAAMAAFNDDIKTMIHPSLLH